MAKETHTFETICAAIKAHRFAPVYLLTGEEPYFIDRISDLLIDNVLTDDVRVFDQQILYGTDTAVTDIFNAARQFPSMMSERRLIVVREAQEVKKLELLANYVTKPLESTVLVINYKYKKNESDKLRTFVAAVKKNGIVFESKKLRDYQMPEFIRNALKIRAVDADAKAIAMLAEHLGSDLTLLYKELDKLVIALSNSNIKRITPEIVEANVGISKDYNSYELTNAISIKNALKAHRIALYFDLNYKGQATTMLLPVLFNYFSNLLMCHYEKDRSENTIMKLLGFHHPLQTTDYKAGLQRFSAKKVFDIIHEIRLADARSKGIGATANVSNIDIMKELLYKIMH
ncbi:MAG: DNA polymerase III subunit delta [Tannerella sp.]|jgi:DNA polymerase-3 subunit delta|nr:DNA polymerase III subunit delta [Tannerella sp.]